MNTTTTNNMDKMIAAATAATEVLHFMEDYIYLCMISEKLFGFGMDTANKEDMTASFESWMTEHNSDTIGIEPWDEKQLSYDWVQDLIGMFGDIPGRVLMIKAGYIDDWYYLRQILEKLFEMKIVDRESASKAFAEFCYKRHCETIGIEPWSERQLDYGWCQDLIGIFGLDKPNC
jgi:hypothetical protein